MKYIKSEHYDKTFLLKNMMGPNCLKLLENLTEGIKLPAGGRALDLGCGTGLTSIFLAKEFSLQVFATDLWIPATENYRRFQEMGLESSIIPIHAEAHELPYAEEYFDTAVSVDAYHYFGRDSEYLDKFLAPLVKKDGVIAIVIPGLIKEFDAVPEELKPFLSPEDFDTLHSLEWWRKIFMQSKLLHLDTMYEYTSDDAWQDWLECDHPYAITDREMMKKGGQYFNFVSMIGYRI